MGNSVPVIHNNPITFNVINNDGYIAGKAAILKNDNKFIKKRI
jgi:hypothetical protein